MVRVFPIQNVFIGKTMEYTPKVARLLFITQYFLYIVNGFCKTVNNKVLVSTMIAFHIELEQRRHSDNFAANILIIASHIANHNFRKRHILVPKKQFWHSLASPCSHSYFLPPSHRDWSLTPFSLLYNQFEFQPLLLAERKKKTPTLLWSKSFLFYYSLSNKKYTCNGYQRFHQHRIFWHVAPACSNAQWAYWSIGKLGFLTSIDYVGR